MAVLDEIFGLGQEGASDPLTGLAKILEDIFGPGASSQPAPQMRGSPAGQGAGPFMIGGPELRTENVGQVGPSGAPPQLMRSPAPQQPQQRQAPPSLMPNLREPSLLDRFAAFAGAPNLGEGIKAATSGMDQDQEQARGTYGALIKRGIEPDLAKLIVSDREMLKKVVPTIFSNALSPAAPSIINLKSKNEFGEETESPYYWNQKTRKLEPASNLTGGGAQSVDMAPTSLSGGQQRPNAGTSAEAPALLPTQPNAAQTPQFMLPGNLATENIGEITAPATQGEAQAAEVSSGRTEPLGTASEAPQGRYVFGPAASEKRLGTGYMQKTDEQGRFLWQRDQSGRMMPVVEPKAAAEARGKAQETLAVKKGEAKIEGEQQVGGLERIINDARSLTDAPGFNDALRLNRMSLDLSVGTPWGSLGGDVLSAPKQIARMYDPENPAWALNDNIGSIQNQLSLVAGRAFLKGQGQVSNFERQMVADAIGNIGKSTSKADYQFRLNTAMRMIENVNAGERLKKDSDYNHKPTQSELSEVVDTQKGTFSTAKLEDLARKYKVAPIDMQEYIVNLYRRSQ